mgnify:FL=1
MAVMYLSSLVTVPYNESSRITISRPSFLYPFVSWDGLYFYGIAVNIGYRFEKHYAFLPLYPLLSRIVVGFGNPTIGLLIVSNCAHALSAYMLYKLTLLVFKDEKKAKTACRLFIVNQASVQMTSAYSESLCACLCFAGFYFYYTKRPLVCALLWMLAGLTRSNAITLAGFFIYSILFQKRSRRQLLYAVITVSGFAYYLYTAYCRFCKGNNPPEWCSSVIPNVYSYVQRKYWDVGFLKYYTVNQIPNFVLAVPLTVLLLKGIYRQVKGDPIGFVTFSRRDPLAPHYYHLLFMIVYTWLFCHVQIINRLFTFMPVVYWIAAEICPDGNLYLFGLYSILNACLFANFYPPA